MFSVDLSTCLQWVDRSSVFFLVKIERVGEVRTSSLLWRGRFLRPLDSSPYLYSRGLFVLWLLLNPHSLSFSLFPPIFLSLSYEVYCILLSHSLNHFALLQCSCDYVIKEKSTPRYSTVYDSFQASASCIKSHARSVNGASDEVKGLHVSIILPQSFSFYYARFR